MATRSDWRPRATPDILTRRAELLRAIRDFMAERDIMEVETPILSDYCLTDPAIESISALVQHADNRPPMTCYLHTSPEYHMKRLLAANPQAIYQICKVFRDGELGRCHQPEFTMLEWYRPGYDQHQLQNECAELLVALGLEKIVRLSYQELFERELAIHPHKASTKTLERQAAALGYQGSALERAGYLELIANYLVRALPPGVAYFIYDYPACLASLARLGKHPVHGEIAERFELFIDGVELANGFCEITDAGQLRAHFELDQQCRAQAGQTIGTQDTPLLAAVEHGMPDYSGVAWGVERLLMVLTGQGQISAVQSFPRGN